MNVAYVRVSTADQNEARQIAELEKHNIEKWFTEKVSAKDTNREKLNEMLDYVREGDTVYVEDFSRLARSTKDLLSLVDRMQARGVNFVSIKENFDTNTPTGKLMLTMIGAINEFERANLLERQKEGIVIAKQEGKYKGRARKAVKDFDVYYQKYMSKEIRSKAELARQLKVTLPTLYRMIEEHLQNSEIEK